MDASALDAPASDAAADVAPPGDAASASNLSGKYDVTVTNGANGCQLPSWTPNASGPGVIVDVKQNAGIDAYAGIGGINVAALLANLVGFPTFTGTAASGKLVLTSLKPQALTIGSCNLQLFVRIDANQVGKDGLSGSIVYTIFPQSGTCSATCQSIQTFTGSRPPT